MQRSNKKNPLRFAGIVCLMMMAMAGLAQAQTATSSQHPAQNPLGEKYDTKLPVEISSDNLEVLQQQSKAIFKGNVLAVQGKVRLKADTMIVHYKQKTDQAAQPVKPTPTPAPSATNSGAGTGSMGAITLIEVEGNVLMATPEESAKGDKGNYQVEEKLLHLTGENVILTRDKNILRGTELVYNLETGRSVLTNKGAAVSGTNDGRVRGVFVPTEDKNKNTGKEKSTGNLAAPTPVLPTPIPAPTGPTPVPSITH